MSVQEVLATVDADAAELFGLDRRHRFRVTHVTIERVGNLKIATITIGCRSCRLGTIQSFVLEQRGPGA